MSEASLYVNQRVVAARGGIKAVVKATRARESSQNMESEGALTPVRTELIKGCRGASRKCTPLRPYRRPMPRAL